MSEEGPNHEAIVEEAKKFLLAAPPGEYEQCVLSLKHFAEDEEAIDEAVSQTIEEWIVKQCTATEIDEKKVLLCEEARLPDGRFINQNNLIPFTFDFIGRRVEEQEEDVEPIEGTPLRQELQDALQKFVKDNLHNGIVGVYDREDGQVIVMTASNISLNNFKTGSIVIKLNFVNGELNGTFNYLGHFYENGCTFGKHEIELSETIEEGDPDDVARAVRGRIQRFFDQWKNKLMEGVDEILNEGMNKLRMKMPFTKTKINWEQEVAGIAAMASS